jgi:hypothetical protein
MMDKLLFDHEEGSTTVRTQGSNAERIAAHKRSFLKIVRNPFTIALLTWLATGIYLVILRIR